MPSELHGLMDLAKFQKSRSYAIDKRAYGFANSAYSLIESCLTLYLGVLPFLWRMSVRDVDSLGVSWLTGSEIAHTMLFILFVVCLDTSLPWTIYDIFVIEEKHGFIKDHLKNLAVTAVLIFPLSALLLFIIQMGGDFFFIYMWLFATVFSSLYMLIYPEFIAPLFDKYVPLPEGDLRAKI
jgi:STE24 endopeptidase